MACAKVHGMVGTVAAPYEAAVSKMERSFLTTALVPTVIFITAYGCVLIASLWSFTDAARWWGDRSVPEQLIVGAAVSAVAWFLAGLFTSNWRKIVRFYEGYPLARLLPRADLGDESVTRRLRALRSFPGCARHVRQYTRLLQGEKRNAETVLYMRYVTDESRHEILPTTIGNIMLSAERYGLNRYGLDPTVLWPRLYWCLPEAIQTAHERFKEDHQVPLALSFVAGLFAVASGITVFVAQGPWQLFLVVCVAGTVLAVGGYLLAIERTEEYAEQIRTAIDLYHQDLQAQWAKPRRDDDEANWFAAAARFVLEPVDDTKQSGAAVDETNQSGAVDEERVNRAPLWASSLARLRSAIGSKLLAAGVQMTGGAYVPASGDAAARSDPGPIGSERRDASRIGDVWRWFVARVRLLWLSSGVVVALTAAGTVALHADRSTVLVAVTDARPGQPLLARTERRPTRDIPRDALGADDTTRSLYAMADVAAGTVLRSEVARSVEHLATVTVSLAEGTSPIADPTGKGVDVLLTPCGRLLQGAAVIGWDNGSTPGVTLLLPASDLTDLRDCSTSGVTLLLPP